MTRPDRDEWHLRGAQWLAEMGDCTRRKVGALIVGPDKRFLGLGYNGTRPGEDGCIDGACPRGRHYKWTLADQEPGECRCSVFGWSPGEIHHPQCPKCQVYICRCERPWPCPDAVAPGSSYDTGPGACIASHAEANAVSDGMQRGAGRMPDAVLYVSTQPCEGCLRMIRNQTDIKAVIWPGGMTALP